MSDDVKMLEAIYQNVAMGMDGIDKLIAVLKDQNFTTMLKKQYKKYNTILDTTTQYSDEFNYKIKKVSQVMTYLMIKMKEMTAAETSEYAKLMITGTTKGIVEITESLHNLEPQNNKITKLANELLLLEENNINELKEYL